jgi:hypothetical protein
MKDDPSKLKSVLLDYFDGIKTNDLEKMNLNTTSDFLLFESGKVWNNDSLWTNGQKYKETRIDFRLYNFNITVDNESGHITYFNDGDIYKQDSLTQTIEWIENATFKKLDGHWKIDFLQSTVRQ